MKSCGYCGRKNDDNAVYCGGCGTSFAEAIPDTQAGAESLNAPSALKPALTSGLAALLICSGIFFILGRIMGDFRGTDRVEAPVHQIGFKYIVFFAHAAISLTLFGLGSLVFTFRVCYNRCLKGFHVTITTVIAFCSIVLLTFGSMFAPGLRSLMCLAPAVMIGMSTGVSAGYYIGAALQIVAGAWLLGWFKYGFADKTPPGPGSLACSGRPETAP